MVFYFTGTGNSLYAAKQIEEEPISIPQVVGQDRMDFTAERIGIVTPIYGHEMPEMVKDFLRRASFHTPYFFLLLTYGNHPGGAAAGSGHLQPHQDRPAPVHWIGMRSIIF